MIKLHNSNVIIYDLIASPVAHKISFRLHESAKFLMTLYKVHVIKLVLIFIILFACSNGDLFDIKTSHSIWCDMAWNLIVLKCRNKPVEALQSLKKLACLYQKVDHWR